MLELPFNLIKMVLLEIQLYQQGCATASGKAYNQNTHTKNERGRKRKQTDTHTYTQDPFMDFPRQSAMLSLTGELAE